jgi:hypothetical protein
MSVSDSAMTSGVTDFQKSESREVNAAEESIEIAFRNKCRKIDRRIANDFTSPVLTWEWES